MAPEPPASRTPWVAILSVLFFGALLLADRYLDARADDAERRVSAEELHVEKATAIRRDARRAYVLMLEGWLAWETARGSKLGPIQDAVDEATRESFEFAKLAPIDAAEEPLLLAFTADLSAFSSAVLVSSRAGAGPEAAPALAGAMAELDGDVANILSHAARSGDRAHGELESIRRSHAWLKWVFLAAVGGLIAALFIRQQRMRTRARLAELERSEHERSARLQSQFFAGMSHELRTPLVAIRGFASDVEERPGADDVSRERSRRIQEEAIGLLGMINNILDAAKIESGQTELLLEDIALDELLARCVSRCQALVRGKPVLVELLVPEGTPRVRADFVKLQQAFTNLVANAVKFTENGRVEVRVRSGEGAPSGMVVVEVEDTGIGIAKETIPLIWKPFQQADATVSRHYGGTGLGLSIARGIVLLHGGSIDVRSTPGVGSTFTVLLPRAGADPASTSAA
jgi:signal transduction histidine kinase